MKIAICDDDKLHLESIVRKTNHFFDNQVDISAFSSPQVLFEKINNGDIYDILLTDIDLNADFNGIELSKEINRALPYCEIIFLTGFVEYATEVYEANHRYFVIKTNIDEDLPKAFEKVLSVLQTDKHEIYIENKQEKVIINIDSIDYIERDKRTSYIKCGNTTHYSAQKLDEFKKELPSWQFTQCHTSYIINFKQVSLYRNSVFYLKNGEEIPVSRKFKKSVDTDFANYIKTLSRIGDKL